MEKIHGKNMEIMENPWKKLLRDDEEEICFYDDRRSMHRQRSIFQIFTLSISFKWLKFPMINYYDYYSDKNVEKTRKCLPHNKKQTPKTRICPPFLIFWKCQINVQFAFQIKPLILKVMEIIYLLATKH